MKSVNRTVQVEPAVYYLMRNRSIASSAVLKVHLGGPGDLW